MGDRYHIRATMLNFDGNWRFDSPGAIAPGVIDGFIDLIGKVAQQCPNPKEVYEFFTRQFATAARRTYWSSSDYRFAVYDCRNFMEEAGANAPIFIDTFFTTCVAFSGSHPAIAIPDAVRINRILYENEAGYEIRPPNLIACNPQAPVPVPVAKLSLQQRAHQLLEQSLADSEKFLLENQGRAAVSKNYLDFRKRWYDISRFSDW